MAHTPLDAVMQHVRSLVGAQSDQSDGELLHAFSIFGDQAAFAALTKRHGPLVLAVCRRVLHQLQDAEDAFQATFIVLARQAASISKKGSLGGWLHRVAYRIALDARRAGARRRKHERRSNTVSPTNPAFQAAWREVQLVLDEEIQRLPEKYREPFILCCLENQSCAAVARRLGLKEVTISSRLAEARQRLQKRLSRRGVELTAVLATAALAPDPIMAAALLTKVVSAATLPASVISERVAFLVHGMTRCLMLQKAKMGVVVFLAVSAMVGVTGVGAFQLSSEGQLASQEKNLGARVVKQQVNDQAKKPALTDQYGDPLPEGAIARLGSLRFRGASFAFAFSRDGKILASAGAGVRLWEAATGRLLRRLPFPNSSESVAISVDGKSFVAGGDNPCLIDMETGKVLREYEVLAGRSRWCVALSPDGQTLAAGSGSADLSTTVVLLDVATGQLKRTLKDFGNIGVRTVAFSPDGKFLASGSDDKTIYLWDVTTGKEWRRFGGHEQPVLAVAFAPKGRFLASSNSREVQLWDLETGKSLHTLKAESYPSPLAFSPDGKLLAYVVRPGTVCIWNLEAEKKVRQWAASTRSVASLAFSADGNVLVSGGGEGAIRRWDTDTGMEIEPDARHTGGVASLLFAPDGKTLFSGGTDWKVLEWDLASSRQRQQLFAKPQDLSEARWPMSNYALAPDGKMVAWTGLIEGGKQPDRAIHLWDASSKKEIRSLRGHEEQIWSLRFSPDAKHLASSGNDETRLWDVATGRELHFLRQVRVAVFSPDGKLLAGTRKDLKTIGLWEVATGKERLTWHSLEKTGSMIFSPSGKTLASLPIGERGESGRFVVRVWAIETGEQLVAFEQQGLIDSLAFSPSGRILAAAARSLQAVLKGVAQTSYTVYLWDVLSGEEIRQIHLPEADYSMAFAPNGRILATGNNDSTILLWDMTGQAQGGKSKSPLLTAKELEELWIGLAGDAPKADRAIWTLARSPKDSVALLKTRLQPIGPADREQVAKLLADLDSDRFLVRDKAGNSLQKMGEAAEGSIRKVMEGNPSLEVRRRLERILDHDKQNREKEVIRRLRAIETAEHIGTLEIRQLLEVIAQRAPNPRVAQAAAAALGRLTKQMAKIP